MRILGALLGFDCIQLDRMPFADQILLNKFLVRLEEHGEL